MDPWRKRIDRFLVVAGIATVIVVVWWNFIRPDNVPRP
jgi:uncharacterized membrane protein